MSKTVDELEKDVEGLLEIIKGLGIKQQILEEQLNKALQLLQAIITSKGI